MDLQQFTLSDHTQGMRLVNMLSSPDSILAHDKAFFKKSISTFCCPMILYSLSSSPSVFLADSAPEPKMLLAFSRK
jgi:hypothetical protein